MKKAIYPGSFDPVTLGHLDVIERSAKMVDHLIVGVLNNNTKSPLFSVDERVNMLNEVTSHLPNVEVVSFRGLLVDFMEKNGIDVTIRGLRAITDFEYELQMAQTNHAVYPDMDTIFLTTNLKSKKWLCMEEIFISLYRNVLFREYTKNMALQSNLEGRDYDEQNRTDCVRARRVCR